MRRKSRTQEQFIDELKRRFGDLVDYSQAEYNGGEKKVTLKCNRCGEVFERMANDLLFNIKRENICKRCAREERLKANTDAFFVKAAEKYGDRYDLSKVDYINNATKICIICPEHGEFLRTPNQFLSGYACPKCSEEKRNGKKK